MMLARSPLVQPGQTRPTNPNNFAVPNGLVGYWGLDPDCLDFTNNLALDLSGQGNNGTLNNLAASALAQGQVGTALTFNGSSSYIGAGNGSSVQLTTALSLSCWLKAASQNNKGLITKYTFPSPGSYSLQTSGFGGNVNFILYNGTNQVTVNGTITTQDSKWHSVVATFNKVSMIIYVDGRVDASSAQSFTVNNSADSLNFGARTNGTADFFSGQLDDIRIYNRALDPWEIIQLYQAGLAGRR